MDIQRTKKAASSDTGNPFSPSSMAGARICARDSLPLPKRSTVSTHPAAAPGTVAAWTLLMGISPATPSASPSSRRTASSVHLPPDRPDPFSADTLPVLAS